MRIESSWIGVVAILGFACAHARPAPRQAPPQGAASAVIDAFHGAASRADEEAYFGLFAEDGVFLGTAVEERWNREAFRAYVHPYFSQGKGWTYLPEARHLTFSAAGDVAWFDEVLKHEKYGVLRGSGVLVLNGDHWKVAQYNLTFTVPNPVAAEVVRVIKDHSAP